ncbi:Peregrin [Escovopsis weberi]|uniref:Peregrin n=1 Tax=Escovopsis weberi TaxID=150374 RepID=A0A0M8N0A8_ESCWE|nr:Peregrin [Escovopsis weberi]
MAPASSSPRRAPTGRRRGRPPGSTNAARAARAAAAAAEAAAAAAAAASEPPPKRRRYIPGGSGGGGRFVDASAIQTPEPAARPATTARSRSAARLALNATSPSMPPRRGGGTRTRAAAAAAADDEDDSNETSMRWGSAAAMAASVKQAEDYKPREERSWEEFHPNLDIEQAFLIFTSNEVDGVIQAPPPPLLSTPSAATRGGGNGGGGGGGGGGDVSATTALATDLNRSMTPSKPINPASTGTTPNRQLKPPEGESFESAIVGTPSRRPRRLTRDVVSFYNIRPAAESAATPKTPKILPIQNQTPKERLDLKQPSYRKTNRIELFESKTFGQARYVDKAMSNVGYQESDNFIRPERTLIKATDANMDDDPDQYAAANSEEYAHLSRIGRVEYDMDEQDDMWLEQYNAQRKQNDLEAITREIFEITMTKIEKEWHALEKRIPKPTPKPPQTHRPRSSSAVAVNGEPHGGEEPDSKCAVCDDGDCENTNAIVFCDGCNLAVHQECYGVPFIPEGQWLCRKCQLCGRGVPTCIFCPNTDGAFKQTNSSKWAHLLCAMWIPEVSLGNHTFMEPVMDVEKVPKTRWKLTCYICRQRMGACIQCGNKNCYQAFHVTCARRARLFLKMKTSQGTLTVLDGGMVLKAFCDKHCPPDYAQENDVRQATRAAKKFYKKNMRGRIWADNQAMANVIAAQHRTAITDHPPDESQMTGAKNSALLGGEKKKGQPPKNLWKLPSGAPIIPQAVFEIVEASIQRFSFRKRKDFLSEACRYWTLKREARRGAALLKRLQLQMESFSSMELTRRNFSAMGPSGKARLARRIEFAESMIHELEQLKALSEEIVQREQVKLDAAELEQDFVDECYFPTAKTLVQAIDKAISNLFTNGLAELHAGVEMRVYVNALAFAQDLGDLINRGIMTLPESPALASHSFDAPDASAAKPAFLDIRERRKLGKRILKAVQPFLETALRVESEISAKPFESLQKELESIIDTSLNTRRGPDDPMRDGPDDAAEDTIMVDAPAPSEINVRSTPGAGRQADLSEQPHAMDGGPEDEGDGGDDDDGDEGDHIQVRTSGLDIIENSGDKGHGPVAAAAAAAADEEMADVVVGAKHTLPNGVAVVTSETPPPSTGYMSMPQAPQEGPPTPPQSNGSLGKEPADPLAEGGVLWYLKSFSPVGTSVCDDHWAAGRDAVRMLSEDLTDLDDEEFKGLGIDMDNMDDGVGASMTILEPGERDGSAGSSARGGRGGRPKRRRASARKR